MRQGFLATTLVAVAIAVLAAQTVGGVFAQNAARVLFVVLCIVGLRTNTVRESLLLCVALLLGVVLCQSESGWLVLLAGIDLAAYFASFIALLTALKIAAERSASILTVGRYLIKQPTGRRFIATASGGHALGVFLNFGAISLMAPLIQSATIRADGTVDQDLERRQMSALLRGFAWILLWAPTTLTQTVLLTLFTEIELGKLVVLGLATSVLMMGIGFAYDRFEWRAHTMQRNVQVAPDLPKRAFLRLALVCTVLIGTTAALQIGLGYNTALSLMFVAPSVTVFWFAFQRGEKTALTTQLAHFWPALESNAQVLTRAAIALGLSGFIGRALAEILPVARLAKDIDLSALPGWLFLAALPVLITLGGQVALSPIIIVVFIGQVVQTFPSLPAAPTHIVFALSAGWAISMFASPNATATLLISATSKIPPTTLTWRWNLKYAAICYAVLVAMFVMLEH